MAKIAVIKTGGKQYKVKEGQVLQVEKLPADKDQTVKLDALLIADENGKEAEVGAPLLDKKVEAKVIEHGRDKKVRVIKYKNKTRYKRNIGHKQAYTKIEIGKL